MNDAPTTSENILPNTNPPTDPGTSPIDRINNLAENGATPQAVNPAATQSPAINNPTIPATPMATSDNITTGITPTTEQIPVNPLKFLVSLVYKPLSTLENELPKFSWFKNSGILLAVSTAIYVVFSLVASIFSTVCQRKRIFLFKGGDFTCDFDRLGEFELGGRIVQVLLTPAIGALVIAAIFFGVSRIFKQTKTNYSRMLAVATIIFPFAGLATILASLLNPLNNMTLVSGVFIIIGLFTGLLFYEGIHIEAGLKGDRKFFFYFVSVLAHFLLVYIVMSLIMKNATKVPSLDFDANNLMQFLK